MYTFSSTSEGAKEKLSNVQTSCRVNLAAEGRGASGEKDQRLGAPGDFGFSLIGQGRCVKPQLQGGHRCGRGQGEGERAELPFSPGVASTVAVCLCRVPRF